MSYTLDIGDQLQADDELIDLFKRKNYKFILRFFDTNYRFVFRTEESGVAFESCIDWCAQNAGNLEDAKEVLVRLFDRFYRDLPASVKDNLAYLVDEIGYHPSRTMFYRSKWFYKELVVSGTTAFASMIRQGRKYLTDMHVQSSFSRARWSHFRQYLKRRVSYTLIEKI